MQMKAKLTKVQREAVAKALKDFDIVRASAGSTYRDYSNTFGCPNCGDRGCYNRLQLKVFLGLIEGDLEQDLEQD